VGKSPQGFRQAATKTCFVFASIQRGLADTYLAPISTMFETTDVNRCAGAYISEKFLNFCVGVLQIQKLPRKRYFGWVPEYSSNGTISGDKNASRHPKDVPLVRKF